MHQDTANRMVTKPTILAAPAVHAFCKADRMWVAALVRELRGVLQNQDRSVALGAAAVGRRKMTAEDLALLNPWVGEEAIRRFGVGPILAGKGNAAAHSFAQSTEQIAKPPPESRILETGDIDF